MLPPFVDSTHCLSYNLTRKGRSVADRIVSVLGYACPDITYSPSLYPITALLLHFMPGLSVILFKFTKVLRNNKNLYIYIFYNIPEEQCYHCVQALVASKKKMFITQTKLLYEVTWKTVEQITKKHVVCIIH